jgi:ubiquinone/menaquinone biosynthesis C-methylase UbiE
MAVSRPPGRRRLATWDDADAYDRFMGRFSAVLAPQLVDFARLEAGQRVLDVGSGPGALTRELVRRVGAEAVTALDPSERFVAAVRQRYPGVAAVVAHAERLPFPDGAFDATLAQLALRHARKPEECIAEMLRVTRPGGVVAVCDWEEDHGRAPSPHGPFWQATTELRRETMRQSLDALEEAVFAASVAYDSFDEWWAVVAEGVGTSAGYAKSLGPASRERLRELCRARLPEGPFTVEAYACAGRGFVR